MKIMADKSLCISLSRKGEFPIKLISSLSITFSAITSGFSQVYKVETPEEGGRMSSVIANLPRLEARSRNTFALKQNVQGED